MKLMKKIAFMLALVMMFFVATPAMADYSKEDLQKTQESVAKYVYNTVKEPQVGSIGGEWAIIGLARSGYNVQDAYYQNYYKVVEKYVKDLKGNLHDRKYTEYSRVIVALSSIGVDARNVAGYDLTKPLGDFDKTIWQGINGPTWALIALDSKDYPMPKNKEAKTQATRQMYIDEILNRQLADGGWDLTNKVKGAEGSSDPDITGMVLQALSNYQDQPKVKKATEEALECMSKKQDKDGGFSTYGDATSESCVQMIVALNSLGIDMNDPRFVKNGKNLVDALMSYYVKGSGFKHLEKGNVDQMGTEQGLYALDSIIRAMENKNSLYNMSDSIEVKNLSNIKNELGLPGKNSEIKVMPNKHIDLKFTDIAKSENKNAINALVARGILNGSDGKFEPAKTMTRAEFATTVVRGLGLEPKVVNQFKDVAPNAWYAGWIGKAYSLGIIKGETADKFNPNGTITRQEAAVMITRAAKLCGMDTELTEFASRDILSGFLDYVKVDSWALESVAFCYNEGLFNGILSDSDIKIQPKQAILREEIAQMFYNLLDKANLIAK